MNGVEKEPVGGKVLDPSKIDYDDDLERATYERRNTEICEKINNGESFGLVITQEISNEDDSFDLADSHGYGDFSLYYAYIVLSDKSVMPYPLFEDASSDRFKQNEWDEYIRNCEEHPEGHHKITASLPEFKEWMKEKFGNQFVGVTEAKYKEHHSQRELKEEAIDEMVSLLKTNK